MFGNPFTLLPFAYYSSVEEELLATACSPYSRNLKAPSQPQPPSLRQGAPCTLEQGLCFPTCALLSLTEAADLTDALDPFIHVLLGLSHQVEGALAGLDVKHKAILQLLLIEGQACIHLLTEVEVDDPQGLLGVVILVVFQDVGVTAHPATPQDKPAFLPGLKGKE